MVAEINDESEEFFGFGDVFNAFDGADANVEGFERGKCDDRFDWRWRKVGHGLSPEICGAGGCGERGVAALVANGGVCNEAKRYDAGPDGECVVVGVVFYRACANLCRNFCEGQFQDAGGFEFFFIGLACVVPAAGENFFGEGAKSVEFFGGGINESCSAKRDDRAVVHRMIKHGACENEAVGECDGDADGQTVGKIAQHAAGG